MVQGELFRENSSYEPQIGSSNSFLSKYQFTLKLDKVLLLLIAMIFALTLSHSFGVERGKRIMEKKFESLIPAQTQTFSHHDPLNDPSEIVRTETVLQVDKPSPPDVKISNSLIPSVPSKDSIKKLGKFTVQLVTYDNKLLAEKEITRLKSKGYDGFMIPSGRFYQVCANNFENKSRAHSQLEELKQTGRYPDAYIRPIVR